MLDVDLKWFDFEGKKNYKNYKVAPAILESKLGEKCCVHPVEEVQRAFLRAFCEAQCKGKEEEVPILQNVFAVPLQTWSNPRKVGICMLSAETFLIPAVGNYPSAFTMDKAPSHMAPQGGRAGCWPSPSQCLLSLECLVL